MICQDVLCKIEVANAAPIFYQQGGNVHMRLRDGAVAWPGWAGGDSGFQAIFQGI